MVQDLQGKDLKAKKGIFFRHWYFCVAQFLVFFLKFISWSLSLSLILAVFKGAYHHHQALVFLQT